MPIPIGIVGLGNIGGYHASHLGDLDCELAGGMDVDDTARERFESEYDAPTFADVADLYDRCEGVIVTTPNRFHEEYVTDALDAGLDVLVEKPLAHTLESAERIAEAAAQADQFCMVGFQSRFARPVEVLKSYLDAGRLGDVYHVEASYVRRRGIPGRGTWFTDAAMAGGGSLIDVGVHVLDLGLHVLGFPDPTEVAGTSRSLFGGREEYAYLSMWGEDGGGPFDVDDSVSAFVRCADERTLTLEVAWAANRPPNHSVVVHGTDGGAVYDLHDGTLELFESDTAGGDHHADTTIETRDGTPHADEMRRFVTAVREGQAPDRNTVEQGLVVQRIVDAIYRSSDRASAVEL